MKYEEYIRICEKAYTYYEKAGIFLTKEEKKNLEVADFGLNDVERTGLQIVVYVNTKRVCAKEMVLLPQQTCAEHKHISTGGTEGKEETFRCRYGKVYLYVDGKQSGERQVNPPDGDEKYYTVSKEIVLNPGEQYTIYPNTLHWFKAGAEGAVITEFSTRSSDETDVFTDVRIKRTPIIK